MNTLRLKVCVVMFIDKPKLVVITAAEPAERYLLEKRKRIYLRSGGGRRGLDASIKALAPSIQDFKRTFSLGVIKEYEGTLENAQTARKLSRHLIDKYGTHKDLGGLNSQRSAAIASDVMSYLNWKEAQRGGS